MKKLGFLLLALTADIAIANPQANSLSNSVAAAGAEVVWTRESAEKHADARQVSALNNTTVSIGQMINEDLSKKISLRLDDKSNQQ